MASPIINEGLQSGIFLCEGKRLKNAGEFRKRAREAADCFFPEEANELSSYFGVIYRYKAGKSRRVEGFLTRKEKLFGEWGEPTHVALVQFFRENGRVILSYRDLTGQDLAFLRKVLQKMGLATVREHSNPD